MPIVPITVTSIIVLFILVYQILCLFLVLFFDLSVVSSCRHDSIS